MSSNGSARRQVGEHFAGDLRRALLDAAAELWSSGDGEGASLREVARRAGVSHAAPAHHFGDGRGLLTALAIEGFQLFTRHLEEALAGEAPASVDQLPVLGVAYAEFAERHPGHFAVMFRPGLLRMDDAALAEAGDAAFAVLRRHVEKCQRAGWQADVDTQRLTVAAWALAHGITALRTQQTLARHYSDSSLDGIRGIVAALLPSAASATRT